MKLDKDKLSSKSTPTPLEECTVVYVEVAVESELGQAQGAGSSSI